MTQQELCVWAKDKFGLVNLPHQSTIAKILARAGELTTMPSKDLLSHRKGFMTHPELDTTLCNWVLYARQNNMKLSGDMIKDKARQLALNFGIMSKMIFSNGWIGDFMKRHNIRLGGTTTPTTSASASASSGKMSATVTANNAIAASVLGSTMPTQPTSLSGVMTLPDGSPVVGAIAFANDPVNAFAPMNTAAAAAAAALTIRELQEMAKLCHALDIFTMSEAGLFYSLSPEKNPWRPVRMEATVATQDVKEMGLRAILNFGHSIGHGITHDHQAWRQERDDFKSARTRKETVLGAGCSYSREAAQEGELGSPALLRSVADVKRAGLVVVR